MEMKNTTKQYGRAYCPNCNHEAGLDFDHDKFCRECGTEIVAHVIPKCGKCDTKLTKRRKELLFKHCPGCGLSVEEALSYRKKRITTWKKFCRFFGCK